MERNIKFSTLFLDLGGVLLTNGWDHNARRLASENFHLDNNELDDRHHLCFDAYEEGKLSLDDYLKYSVFFTKRDFTTEEFKDFMFAQSRVFPEMIELIKNLKSKYNLKVAVVNNEGRELNAYRINKFGLRSFVDYFVSSCFVHLRKPDKDIFRTALDIGQVEPENVIYIEDRQLFVEIARSLGIAGIRHVNYGTTVEKLADLGLTSTVGTVKSK